MLAIARGLLIVNLLLGSAASACVAKNLSAQLTSNNGRVSYETPISNGQRGCLISVDATSGDLALNIEGSTVDRSETAVRTEWLLLIENAPILNIHVRNADPLLDLHIQYRVPTSGDRRFNDTLNQADESLRAGNFNTAVSAYTQAMAVDDVSENHRAIVAINLARLLLTQAESQSAVVLLTELLSDPRVTEYWRVRVLYERAATYQTIGNLIAAKDDLCLAASLMNRSQSCGQSMNTKPVKPYPKQWLAETINRIGLVAHMRGQLTQAEKLYQLALVALSGESTYIKALITSNLGGVFHERGDWDEAQKKFLDALASYELLQNQHNIWSTKGNLANSYLQEGELDQAISLLLDTLLLVREDAWPGWEADQLDRIGLVYLQSGDYKSSDSMLRRALQIRNEQDSARTNITLRNLGTLMRLTGRVEAALDFHSEARALEIESGKASEAVVTSLELAQDYYQLRNFAALKSLLDSAIPESLKLGSKLPLGEFFLLRANVGVHQGKLQVAAEYLDKAMQLGSENQSLQARIKSTRANMHWQLHEFDEAIVSAESAYKDLLDARQKIDGWKLSASFYDKHSHIVSNLIDMYILQGKVEEALNVALATRNFAFIDQSLWKSKARRPEIAELRSVKQKLASKYNARSLVARRGGSQEELNRIDFEISESSLILDAAEVSLAKTNTGFQFLSLSELQASLEESSVALVHFLGDLSSWQWQITKEGITSRKLPARDKVEAIVRESNHRIFSRTGSKSAVEALGSLVNSRDLVGVSKLYVLPDGVTSTIPYSVLPTETGGAFVDEFAIEIFDGATTIDTKASASRALIFTNPKYNPESYLQPLPHSKREGALISAKLERNGIHAETYEGTEAQKDQFLQRIESHPSIVHIAVHGLVYESAGIAGLKFSDNDIGHSSGFLSVAEIEDLKIRTNLVVLSACDGALGVNLSGEAPYSLSRAFKLAGARTVLATLWPLKDALAPRFMDTFYKEWLLTRDAADALRQTQLHFRNNPRWKDPSNWAGFMVAGSLNGIKVNKKETL